MSKAFQILVVDDSPENIFILGNILNEYEVSFALSGEKAIDLAINVMQPDLIMLDDEMPLLDGYNVCRILKENARTRHIPIIFLTDNPSTVAEVKGLSLGASDYLIRPLNPLIVKYRVNVHLNMGRAERDLRHKNSILEDKVMDRIKEMTRIQDVTIQSMASLAEARDGPTGYHIRRTQLFMKLLAIHLSKRERYSDYLVPERIELLYKSAPLHDIGKVGVSDSILLKPGKLNEEEYELMKKHVQIGYDAIIRAERILGSNSFLALARELIYSHHEKWDGSGYPRGLKGEAIPLSGRLMALCDVYDALVTERIYKKAYSHEKTMAIILSQKGLHFDPEIVDIFIEINNEFRIITENFRD